jgi:hypothetical protein
MATYQATCKWCGKTFNTTNDLSVFGIGSKYCSKKCKQDAEGSKESKSQESNSSTTISKTIYVEPEKSAEQIKAEAEVDRMKRDEKASQPWKFDSHFYNSASISKISYPDTAEDIEKTVLRIIKTAVDKIKGVIDLSHAEFQQQITGDQKAMWKPFYEEINFVDACIEKANEGIKKLRRFEGNSINAMMADCQDSLDDLKNKWYVKLIEKRDKKKKQTKIMVIVIIVLFAAMMIGLAIAS